jgi:hypothetical protein
MLLYLLTVPVSGISRKFIATHKTLRQMAWEMMASAFKFSVFPKAVFCARRKALRGKWKGRTLQEF